MESTTVRVLLLTWNAGNCAESSLDESTLFNDEDFEDPNTAPHLVFIGFQEVDASMHNNIFRHFSYSDWAVKLMKQLSYRGFIMLHHETFPGLLTILFVSYKWLPYVNMVEADTTKLAFESLVGSKGAIGIRAIIGSDTVCFINSHLPAHIEDHKERDKAYLNILADQFYAKCGTTVLNHDFVFWLGDLNFRIDEIPNEEVKQFVTEENYVHLWKYDQLKFSMASGRSFSPFEEAALTFPPTYKFNVGTQEYDTSEKKRKPAWCDRILWRDKPEYKIEGNAAGVQCLKYTAIFECCASDHKPVYGVYEMKLRPILEGNPTESTDIFVQIDPPENSTESEDCFSLEVKKGESIKFRMRPSKGFRENIDGWDWVGVYTEEAIKLKDYCSSKYLSTSDWAKSRIKFDPKEFKNSASGRYRIIYHSSKLKSAVGVSCLVKIIL